MQCGVPDGIMGEKEDINGKIGRIHVKAGVWLLKMHQCQLFSFDKCPMVIKDGRVGEAG